ncbi:FecR domain-containing protein [Bradyrhizobium sp. STM 3557]|uniref:FecR domain-containing protein n=1 Tax=Bradyrhizobium sp. STM 3557 TaxID=578920 RepID=UPI00388EF855
MSAKSRFKHVIVAAFAMVAGSTAWAADGDPWSVSKSSGEVWVTTQGAQQVALGSDVLKPGDTIRTGHNGRVLLTRGAETILIAPNSVVGLPTDAQDGMATTILQRAGSILLDVERRNVKHFEVETPYLAAVVKGTQFRVTIEAGRTKVDVSRGQVEVSDFKSGQIAQVTPGQSVISFASGRPGLHLSGSGTFAPIEQGRPRAPTIDRVPVPKGGLQAPREAKGSVIHAIGPMNTVPVNPAAQRTDQRQGAATMPKPHGVRISSSLGEVKLNVGSATHGLAHGAVPPGPRNGSHKTTTWSDNNTAGASNGSGNSNATTGGDGTNPAAISATVATAIGSASASANVAGSSSDTSSNDGIGGNGPAGNGGGNGSQGKGNAYGNGNGANSVAQWLNYLAERTHGNGNAYGLGNGNGIGKGKN